MKITTINMDEDIVRNITALMEKFKEGMRRSVHLAVAQSVDPTHTVLLAVNGKKFLKQYVNEIWKNIEEHECDSGPHCPTFLAVDVAIILSTCEPWVIGAYQEAADRDYAVMLQGVKTFQNYRVVQGWV